MLAWYGRRERVLRFMQDCAFGAKVVLIMLLRMSGMRRILAKSVGCV